MGRTRRHASGPGQINALIAIALRDRSARCSRCPAPLRLQDEEAAIDVADADDTACKSGMVAPDAVEVRAVVGRQCIEESSLAERAAIGRGEIEEASETIGA